MKRILYLFLVFGFSFASVFALPNPWTSCKDDFSCAVKVSGFNFPIMVKNYSIQAMKDMIQITFPFKNKRNNDVIVRKSEFAKNSSELGNFKDISGVYNDYPVNKEVKLKNGVSFYLRGAKKKFNVALFSAETGYYSIYSKKGLRFKELNYFYKLFEEAEAPRIDYDNKPLTIDELMDLRRVDGIVEPVYTQDCFPKTLLKRGVTPECFERANLGDDSFCSLSQIKMIKEYYKKGQDKDPLNDGNGQFCAEE